MRLKYIPNILSGIRILLVPVFVYLFFTNYDNGRVYVPLCVFLFAGLTDILDGYLARRNNWITNLGKLLDPLADKLMQCAVLICFAMKIPVLWWLAGMFILKELFMICGALIVLKRIKVAVKSHWYGKITTGVFYAIAFLVFIFKLEGPAIIAVFTPALILELFCVVMYVFDTLRINADLKKENKTNEQKLSK